MLISQWEKYKSLSVMQAYRGTESVFQRTDTGVFQVIAVTVAALFLAAP